MYPTKNVVFSHRSSELSEETLEACINLALVQLYLQQTHTDSLVVCHLYNCGILISQ